jgi:hypothetical protein
MIPEDHQAVYLHPLTREGEAAGLAIAHGLPELPEAWAFFQEACRLRAGTPYSRAVIDLYADFLRRHRDGPTAERALIRLDQSLRRDLATDPSAEILKLAQAAGVAEEVRRRYARLARSHLSQWVYLDPKKPPEVMMIRLSDEAANDGWHHRVLWGHGEWRSEGRLHTPSLRYGGPLPYPGAWHELRVPLIWLDLHDTPIHGISFWQRGGAVVWDRTAIRFDGGERVLLDDTMPEGKAEGSWRWVSQPRRSGAKAHTDGSGGGEGRHELWGLQEPVIEHVAPPLQGPCLSQWVYLDPKKPPRAVAMNLYAGGKWRLHVLWGEPAQGARCLGKLPAPGRWQELRVPLAWPQVACLPIEGISFDQAGGRVVWDRTAVVAGGKERVVVEDEVPAGSTGGAAWEWVEQPVKSGKKAHTQAPPNDYSGHSVVHLKEPVVEQLALPPQRIVAVLKDQIPKLGPSEEAWDLFRLLLQYDRPEAEGAIAWYTWFLQALPDHPQALYILERLLTYHKAIDERKAPQAVEAIMESCRVSRSVRYEFNRRYNPGGSAFLRTWLVIGPFPNPAGKGHDRVYPPETEAVDLARSYPGIRGPVRWKVHRSAEDMVTLDPLFDPNENAVAYAVCWVHTEQRAFATLEVGSDDGCKVWLNRKLALDHNIERAAAPRQDIVPVYLRRGWNEILVKVDELMKDWQFCAELVDREGRSLLPSVRVAVSPPPRGR